MRRMVANCDRVIKILIGGKHEGTFANGDD